MDNDPDSPERPAFLGELFAKEKYIFFSIAGYKKEHQYGIRFPIIGKYFREPR